MTDHPISASGLPYRPCAGILLLNSRAQVWVGKRIKGVADEDVPAFPWQLPQGGIDDGEKPREAAMRELYEEVGTRNAEIIAKARKWFYYDLPDEVLARKKKNTWGGQRQKYFAMKFLGKDKDVDLTVHKPEFSEWRWAELEELPELAIPFKRSVYEQVVDEFAPVVAKLRSK